MDNNGNGDEEGMNLFERSVWVFILVIFIVLVVCLCLGGIEI